MRGRFKKKTTGRPSTHSLALPFSGNQQPKWSQGFDAQWHDLHQLCRDRESQARLIGLRERFDLRKSGVSESAAAEVELATFFVHAGFSISFLQESKARTADLECYLGINRLFLEITVIMPATSRKDDECLEGAQEREEGELRDGYQQRVLLHRLVARMTEKAKQLNRYCAPVILAVTVPDHLPRMNRKLPVEKLDLQRLAGGVANVLPGIPQLSAVLLTIWGAEPQESRSNIRLSNIYYHLRRSSSSMSVPRLRVFAINSSANYGLSRSEIQKIQQAM